MSKTNGWIVVIILVIIVGALIYWAESAQTPTPLTNSGTEAGIDSPIATATYSCDNGKQIVAAYYQGTTTIAVQAGQPPVPTGSVALTFNDGTAPMTLNQTISADGARYGNTDDSFVFWNKGNQALVMKDNSMDLDYTNCATAQ